MRSEFSIQDGIRVQSEQLRLWKAILQPGVYSALEEYALRTNHEAKSGYDIKRGTTLDSYINNYMLGHRF
jgi:hypothetical protein